MHTNDSLKSYLLDQEEQENIITFFNILIAIDQTVRSIRDVCVDRSNNKELKKKGAPLKGFLMYLPYILTGLELFLKSAYIYYIYFIA